MTDSSLEQLKQELDERAKAVVDSAAGDLREAYAGEDDGQVRAARAELEAAEAAVVELKPARTWRPAPRGASRRGGPALRAGAGGRATRGSGSERHREHAGAPALGCRDDQRLAAVQVGPKSHPGTRRPHRAGPGRDERAAVELLLGARTLRPRTRTPRRRRTRAAAAEMARQSLAATGGGCRHASPRGAAGGRGLGRAEMPLKPCPGCGRLVPTSRERCAVASRRGTARPTLDLRSRGPDRPQVQNRTKIHPFAARPPVFRRFRRVPSAQGERGGRGSSVALRPTALPVRTPLQGDGSHGLPRQAARSYLRAKKTARDVEGGCLP
jgi:hypothetical protein